MGTTVKSAICDRFSRSVLTCAPTPASVVPLALPACWLRAARSPAIWLIVETESLVSCSILLEAVLMPVAAWLNEVATDWAWLITFCLADASFGLTLNDEKLLKKESRDPETPVVELKSN